MFYRSVFHWFFHLPEKTCKYRKGMSSIIKEMGLKVYYFVVSVTIV